MPAAVARIRQSFPIFARLSDYLRESKVMSGLRVGWHCHLTWLTALAIEPLADCGARLALSECNPETSESAAVEYMRERGAVVSLGSDACQAVLASRPQVLSDTGLTLISRYLAEGGFALAGACEITTSGITRLRALDRLPLPVININGGQLKSLIENFHGVGDGLVEAVSRLTGQIWSGRRAAVAGYGRVGAGVAHYLRRSGASVSVVECDPVRRLVAHYDGFLLCSLKEALRASELIVTATGAEGLIGADEWLAGADGLHVFNVGHWAAEVSPDVLCDIALSRSPVAEHLEELVLPAEGGGTKRLYLACGS